VKLANRSLAHKSEAGAVRLGLASAAEVAGAVAAITEAVAAGAPEALCDDFLVERMIADPVAEILIGIRRDSGFGQVMVLASGGTLVELVRDSRTLLLPTDREAVAEALASLKVSKLLGGFRGRPAGDTEAAVAAVLAVAAFAEANRERLEELEVNPLLVLRDGVVAVDVVLRIRSEG
jgi:succinyl-CoA synthetase beta subunit